MLRGTGPRQRGPPPCCSPPWGMIVAYLRPCFPAVFATDLMSCVASLWAFWSHDVGDSWPGRPLPKRYRHSSSCESPPAYTLQLQEDPRPFSHLAAPLPRPPGPDDLLVRWHLQESTSKFRDPALLSLHSTAKGSPTEHPHSHFGFYLSRPGLAYKLQSQPATGFKFHSATGYLTFYQTARTAGLRHILRILTQRSTQNIASLDKHTSCFSSPGVAR